MLKSTNVKLLLGLSVILFVAGCSNDDEFVANDASLTEKQSYTLGVLSGRSIAASLNSLSESERRKVENELIILGVRDALNNNSKLNDEEIRKAISELRTR